MVVSLKQNYHFVDLLLDQAIEADLEVGRHCA